MERTLCSQNEEVLTPALRSCFGNGVYTLDRLFCSLPALRCFPPASPCQKTLNVRPAQLVVQSYVARFYEHFGKSSVLKVCWL